MTLFPVHPLYRERQADWREYRLCYEGGRPYTSAYLHKHPKEPAKNYATRLERAIHPNHVRAVIDTYAAYLYKAPIAREAGGISELLEMLWADMDLTGAPANEFYEQVAQLVQRGGRAAVVVDKLRAEEGEATTRAQERELGLRPYTYAVDTEDILNWRVQRDGRLEWVVIREGVDLGLDPMGGGTGSGHKERGRVWYADRWELYEVEVEEGSKDAPTPRLIAQGSHPCGEVPVVMTFWGARSGVELIGDSALTDLAPMNRRLMNYVSLIDEQAYQSTFSMLAAPQSTFEALEKVNWSPSGVIPYHDDVAKPPHYLSPDSGQIEVLRKEVDKTEASIRSLSGLGRMNADMGYAVSSGIALSYITMDKDALLSKFGQRMARLEAKVDELAQKWMGITPVPVTRAYPTNFDPADLETSLKSALQVASLELSGRAEAEVKAAAVRAFLADKVNQDELQLILEEMRQTSGT